MQSSEYSSDVISSPRSSDDTSESVLYTLKSVEISTGHARQHGVAIVKSRAHNRARNHVGGVSRHSRSHMTKCSDMEIAASAHVIDMFIKGEFPSSVTPKLLICFEMAIGAPAIVGERSLETAIVFDDVPNTADSDLSGLSARQLCSSQS